MASEPTLLPCPFCGTDAVGPIDDGLCWYVKCNTDEQPDNGVCGAETARHDSEEAAIEAWNRRAPSTAAAKARREAQRDTAILRAALVDAVSALRYIEQSHGRLYGVGWDRVYGASDAALSAARTPEAGDGA